MHTDTKIPAEGEKQGIKLVGMTGTQTKVTDPGGRTKSKWDSAPMDGRDQRQDIPLFPVNSPQGDILPSGYSAPLDYPQLFNPL